MVKHTETIRQQIADELFEYVWPFCGVGAVGANNYIAGKHLCNILTLLYEEKYKHEYFWRKIFLLYDKENL